MLVKIIIEEGLKDADELVFELDTENSEISKDLSLDGWKIKELRLNKRP